MSALHPRKHAKTLSGLITRYLGMQTKREDDGAQLDASGESALDGAVWPVASRQTMQRGQRTRRPARNKTKGQLFASG